MLLAYPPLSPDNPILSDGTTCPLCRGGFLAGQLIVLLPIKPASEEDAAKMRGGRPFTAEAQPAHLNCAEFLVKVITER